MEQLYNISLFKKKIEIDKIQYEMNAQFLIHTENDYYLKVALMKSNIDEILLLAINPQNNVLQPITDTFIPYVISALKNKKLDGGLSDYFYAISDSIDLSVTQTQLYEFSKKLKILVGCQENNICQYNFKLDFSNDKYLIPKDLLFVAFDGINTSLYFNISEREVCHYNDCGVLSPIRIKIDEKFAGEYYTQYTKIKNDMLEFRCTTKANSLLKSKKISHLQTKGLNVYDMSDFLLSSAGLINAMKFPENHKNHTSWYTLIIPVEGLMVNDEIGVGGVNFFHKDNDEMKTVLESYSELHEFEVLALVHTNDSKIFNALESGKRQIEQALDVLISLLKDDSLLSTYTLGKNLLSRNINIFERKIKLSNLVHISCPYTGAYLFGDMTFFDEKEKLIVSEEFNKYRDEIEKIEMLLIKANGIGDQEITPLLNSLKWVRKAWDATSYEDRIISSVIALEFIVSKEPNVPMLSKSVRKECVKIISPIIKANDDAPLESVIDKFHRTYTETPFMKKLRNLIERLNIPVSESEFDLISNSRDIRNGIIHGKSQNKILSGDIYRLCAVISRIAFYKLNSMEV